LSSGDNGTYTVATGDSCILFGPPDQACVGSFQPNYRFVIASGGSNGNLSGTTRTGSNSKATFHRTSSGNVEVDLRQQTADVVDCHISGGCAHRCFAKRCAKRKPNVQVHGRCSTLQSPNRRYRTHRRGSWWRHAERPFPFAVSPMCFG